MNGGLRRGLVLAAALLCAGLYVAATHQLYRQPRPPASGEMQIAVPRFAQVVMAAGDRHLAANLAGFRALVVSTESMTPESYRILGRVQSDVAWFNPAHEDNYYIATAILPWVGELEATQYVLRRASEARPFDWQPAFYHGFNELHFRKDVKEAVAWLRVAANQASDEMTQIQLRQMAANWADKGEDREFSVGLLRAMAKEARHKAFAAFLEKRAVRLENMAALERAAAQFREQTGRLPSEPRAMVEAGMLSAVPVDPFGATYVVDPQGKIGVRR